jgi:hypothetical protein
MEDVVKKTFLLLALLLSARGTVHAQHFVFEPYAGLSFNFGYSNENALGLESGTLLGVGGKLKGFPPVFSFTFAPARCFSTTTTSHSGKQAPAPR